MSCDNCPFKKDVEEAAKHGGPKWGKAQELFYCHGQKDPKEKGEEEGCAVLWSVWGAIGTFGEMMHLRKEFHLPDVHFEGWDLDDWRLGARIHAELEKLAFIDARS